MLIQRTNPLTGKVNTREIDCTPEQLKAWEAGALIQNVMPHLSADDREFMISGCTPEDWAILTGPELPDDEALDGE